jgi:F-type H+-transporting ATPase subunit alpha
MKTEPEGLKVFLDHTFTILDHALGEFRPELKAHEVGVVKYVSQGISRVEGLPRVRSEELVRFPGNLLGMVFNVDPKEVGVILLDKSDPLRAGAEVRRTGKVLDVPVGEALLGRVVDALGRPLDKNGPVRTLERRAVEREAPAIMDRSAVTVPVP